MSKGKERQKQLYNHYYKTILLQFLGLEKELKYHNEYSCWFIHNNTRYILWMGANKLNDCKNGTWIENADKWIIDNVLIDKTAPYFK